MPHIGEMSLTHLPLFLEYNYLAIKWGEIITAISREKQS